MKSFLLHEIQKNELGCGMTFGDVNPLAEAVYHINNLW